MSTEEANARYVSFGCGCTWIGELESVAPLACPQHDSKRRVAPVLTWAAKGTPLGIQERDYSQ